MRKVYHYEETAPIYPGISFLLVNGLVRSDDAALVSGRGIKDCIDRAGPHPARPKRTGYGLRYRYAHSLNQANPTKRRGIRTRYGSPGVGHRTKKGRTNGRGHRPATGHGDLYALYQDGCFDRVFASLILHHLTRYDKRRALGEAFRVLKPGGELHVADFGKPHDLTMWLISLVVRWAEEVHDNILGLLPIFLAEAGFHPVEESIRYRTVTGTLTLYRACKPSEDVL